MDQKYQVANQRIKKSIFYDRPSAKSMVNIFNALLQEYNIYSQMSQMSSN